MKKTVIFTLAAILATLALAAILRAEEGVFHGGDIVYTEPVKAVLFSHKAHVEDLGLSCDMCHAGLFDMANGAAQANPDFTMDSLYKGKYCGACHSPNGMAFASDTQCARCHIGVKGLEALSGGSAGEKKEH